MSTTRPADLVRARRVALRWAPVSDSVLLALARFGPSTVVGYAALCRRFLARPSNRALARAVLREHAAAARFVVLHTGSDGDGFGDIGHAVRTQRREHGVDPPVAPPRHKPPMTVGELRGCLAELAGYALVRAQARTDVFDLTLAEPTLAAVCAQLAGARCEPLIERLCLRAIHFTPATYERVLFVLRLRHTPPPEAPCPTHPDPAPSETPPSTSPT